MTGDDYNKCRMNEDYPRILSIQSHVAHGYVGNKAATFPLLLHGFDVDAINTVSLSNHSGYPVIRGHRMDLAEYLTILEGLRANNFLVGYKYVLTGYVNNAEIIRQIHSTVEEIRSLQCHTNGESVMYFCDPVMGDDGKMYCKEEVVQAYRDLLPCTSVLTPNYYEASLLSGIEVNDITSATESANWFHAHGVPTVVIKSFKVPNDPTKLQFLFSCATVKKAQHTNSNTVSNSDDSNAINTCDAPTLFDVSEVHRYTGYVPYHDGHYTGTGDIFAASLVAFYHKYSPTEAVAKTMAVLQDLILATRETGGIGEAELSARELRVTRNPDGLLHPVTHIDIVDMKENTFV